MKWPLEDVRHGSAHAWKAPRRLVGLHASHTRAIHDQSIYERLAQAVHVGHLCFSHALNRLKPYRIYPLFVLGASMPLNLYCGKVAERTSSAPHS